ncbi:hypothetical protein [Streptomyces chartreusis]
MWTTRLLDATGREPLGIRVAWEAIEGALQTELPADYAELCEAFGGGVFSGPVYLLCVDEGKVFDLVAQWRSFLSDAQDYGAAGGEGDPVFAPYRIYEPGQEVIPWGSTEWGAGFYWLADASAGHAWPIVARMAGSMNWHRYDMGVPEFVTRILTDPEFQPFSIAGRIPGVSFTSVSELSEQSRAHPRPQQGPDR